MNLNLHETEAERMKRISHENARGEQCPKCGRTEPVRCRDYDHKNDQVLLLACEGCRVTFYPLWREARRGMSDKIKAAQASGFIHLSTPDIEALIHVREVREIRKRASGGTRITLANGNYYMLSSSIDEVAGAMAAASKGM